jgi:hypothetical protein
MVGDRGRVKGGGRAAQHASAHHGASRSSPHRWVTAAESKEEAVQPSMQVLTTALPDPLPTGG